MFYTRFYDYFINFGVSMKNCLLLFFLGSLLIGLQAMEDPLEARNLVSLNAQNSYKTISVDQIDLKTQCCLSLFTMPPKKLKKFLNQNYTMIPLELVIFMADVALLEITPECFVKLIGGFPACIYSHIALKVFYNDQIKQEKSIEDKIENKPRLNLAHRKCILAQLLHKLPQESNIAKKIIECFDTLLKPKQSLIIDPEVRFLNILLNQDIIDNDILDFLSKEGVKPPTQIIELILELFEFREKDLVENAYKKFDTQWYNHEQLIQIYDDNNELKKMKATYSALRNYFLRQLKKFVLSGFKPNPQGFVPHELFGFESKKSMSAFTFVLHQCKKWIMGGKLDCEYALRMCEEKWAGQNLLRNRMHAQTIKNFYTTHSYEIKFPFDCIPDADYLDNSGQFDIVCDEMHFFYRKALKILKKFYPEEFVAYKTQQKVEQLEESLLENSIVIKNE